MSTLTENDLFDISTRLLIDWVQPLAMADNIPPADMVAMLMMTIGRITGKMGYRHMSCDQYWKEVVEHGEPLFRWGFDSERKSES